MQHLRYLTRNSRTSKRNPDLHFLKKIVVLLPNNPWKRNMLKKGKVPESVEWSEAEMPAKVPEMPAMSSAPKVEDLQHLDVTQLAKLVAAKLATDPEVVLAPKEEVIQIVDSDDEMDIDDLDQETVPYDKRGYEQDTQMANEMTDESGKTVKGILADMPADVAELLKFMQSDRPKIVAEKTLQAGLPAPTPVVSAPPLPPPD